MRLKDIEGQRPSVLLVDYHLDAGVTGLDVVAALRGETGIDMPVVVLTADHSDTVTDEVREAGHPLLHKPVKPAALRALLNRLLARRDVA